MLKKPKDALYWLAIIFGSPLVIYFALAYVFGDSSYLCFLSLPSGFLILYIWVNLKERFKKPTNWDDLDDFEKPSSKKPSSEKYSVGKGSRKRDRGLLSRLFGDEDRCEKCGTELEYKKGAGSHYCPECQEYRWK